MQTNKRDDQEGIEQRPHEHGIRGLDEPSRWIAVPESSLYVDSSLAQLIGRTGLGTVSVPGFGSVVFLAAIWWPFTTQGEGDDDWQVILDDGEPYCKRRILENLSEEVLKYEIMWDQPDANDPNIEQWDPNPICVPPRSQIIVECAIRKIRVRGPQGARGSAREYEYDEKPGTVWITGSGIAVKTGPTFRTVPCRKYQIRNNGPGDATVKLVRAAQEGGTDTETTTPLAAGNTMVVRCRFMEISVSAPDNTRTSVTPQD